MGGMCVFSALAEDPDLHSRRAHSTLLRLLARAATACRRPSNKLVNFVGSLESVPTEA